MPELDDRSDIENLVRQSLRQRSEDVEATPALWEEVDRRVGRHRRWQAWSWSLAGVTAVLAAFAIVPGLLDTAEGPGGVPAIAPLERAPAAGAVPTTMLFDDGGRLTELDLATGDAIPVDGDPATAERPLVQLEVRPGSDDDAYAVLGVRDGEGPASLELVTTTEPPIQGRATLPAFEDAADFVPSVAWSPDADLAAYTVPDGDGGTGILLWVSPTVEELEAGLSGIRLSAGLAPDARLLDWTGATSAPGDESVLYLDRGDDTIVALGITVAGDGSLEVTGTGGSEDLTSGLDLASSHATPGSSDEPRYLLRSSDAGAELLWTAPSGESSTVALDDLPGADGDTEPTWIDAKQDAVLVGDGEQVWLLAHDGRGAFVEPTLLDVETRRAALLDAIRPGAEDGGDADPEPPEPTPATPESPAEGSDVDQGGASANSDLELPEPVVVAQGPELVLVEPDGATQTLYRFPSEGHSTIWGVSVRPGSTADDLTVALLTQAEGMYDVRWLRVVEGEVDGPHLFEFPEVQLATGVQLGTVPHPVWSPEGDLLAFVNALPAGGSELWMIGWDDQDPTQDPNRAVTQFALDSSTPLRAERWAWTDEGDGVAREGELLLTAVEDDPASDIPMEHEAGRVYALPLERQADGAVALRSEIELQPRTREDIIGDAGDGALVELPGPRLGVWDAEHGDVPLDVSGLVRGLEDVVASDVVD